MKCLYSIQFLAPTGAQEMLMFVLMAKVCLIEQSIFIFLGQRSLRKQSGNIKSIEIRVIQSEPKILRLVLESERF